MKKIILVAFLLSFLMIGSAMGANSPLSSAARQSSGPSIKGTPIHHFLVEGYVDEFWLSFNKDGTVNGYDDATPYYVAPILGMWAPSRGMLLFIDFPTGSGGYELMMMLVYFPSLRATGYFTFDGLTVDGPFSYQLIYVGPGETHANAGKALAVAAQAEQPRSAFYGFWLRPYIDEQYLDRWTGNIIYGYADVPGYPGYPAPTLGVVAGDQLIFVDDYLSAGPGYYELRLNLISMRTLHGTSYATVDGISVDGPMEVWLERM